jgi:integrase
MASVYQRGSTWYLRYKDARGRWIDRASKAETKKEAKRIAGDLERRAERQRLGLEPMPADENLTLGDLIKWWLETYFKDNASYSSASSFLRLHIINSEDVAKIALSKITPQWIETFLSSKNQMLSAASLNHLRGFIGVAFNHAIRAGKWTSANPVSTVRKRKVPRRAADSLSIDEARLVLAALAPRWRPIFAVAIYQGLRKGELCALQKVDVDLPGRRLHVRRSWDNDTTKGGHIDTIPISEECVPYFEAALAASSSELVFPGTDGEMMRRDVKFEAVLRRALARAGIVTGYEHVCRAKGCTHAELASDSAVRRCPEHNHKLWPKARVRPIRFHSLRHTTATLLMEARASLAAVQKIMRHRDPRMTTEVYGHLAPGYLKDEIDRLSLGDRAQDPRGPEAAVQALLEQSDDRFAASLLHGARNDSNAASRTPTEPKASRDLVGVGVSGFEPPTSWSRTILVWCSCTPSHISFVNAGPRFFLFLVCSRIVPLF